MCVSCCVFFCFFFFQAEDGIRDGTVTGVQTCALPISAPAPSPGKLRACIAEFQTAGRGRRGRRWSTPLGGGLCLSVAWQFATAPADLSALTLAVGVVARRVLARVAGVAIALKWPNDLVWDE